MIRLAPLSLFLLALAACGGAARTGARQAATTELSVGARLAATPPMGWNSWNKFACTIDEQLIEQTADAMVKSGMRDAGYKYVNIDDCWMAKTRDAHGNLQSDPVHFPHGINGVADYVHSKGLKLGVYSSAGTKTCQGLPASLDHEAADAKKFAEWGVDYLKYDNCNNQKRPEFQRYSTMGKALEATGRPIVFSLCEWGDSIPWVWGRQAGGMLWRTTGDISDRWTSMIRILDKQVAIAKYSGPGGWNDPDMLEVGNGRMSYNEYVAHFSLWALLNAPLIAGNDLRSMSDSTRAILTNRDVIAVDQDWGGQQGTLLSTSGDTQVWVKPMHDGSKAVILLNRGTVVAPISVAVSDLGLAAKSHQARNLWTHTTATIGATLQSDVPGHSVAMFVVK
ncbi:MAG: glycoside hydrolase family 27 protein [Gemmatimonadales bacterium]